MGYTQSLITLPEYLCLVQVPLSSRKYADLRSVQTSFSYFKPIY